MYLSMFCRRIHTSHFLTSRSLSSSFNCHKNVGMTVSRSRLSTSPSDRRLFAPRVGQISTGVLNTNSSVRHAHKLVDLQKLNLPKKLIGWQNRIMLRWKLGNKFDAEEFLQGVMGSFVYATECIANGNSEALQSLMTDEGHVDIPFYMLDAQTSHREVYLVSEDDIVLVKVTGIDFKQMAEFSELRDVTVLSVYVWIAYMKDCLKVLEGSNPTSDASWSEMGKQFSEMQKMMQEQSRHAEFQFQRAFDQKLESALTDWLIAKVTYKIPKRFDEN